MNKKEKKIVQDFYDSLDYQVDFNKINNKIKINDENFSKKKVKNYKVLSTVFACLLTIGVIMPFTIEYFEQKYKTNNPTTEETTSEENTLTGQPPSAEVSEESHPASSEEITSEDEVGFGPPSGNTSSQGKPSNDIDPSFDHATSEAPQDPETSGSLIFINQNVYHLMPTYLSEEKENEISQKEYIIVDGYMVYLEDLLAYSQENDEWFTMIE